MSTSTNVSTTTHDPERRDLIALWFAKNVTYTQAQLAKPWTIDWRPVSLYQYVAQALMNEDTGEHDVNGRAAIEAFVREHMPDCDAEDVANVVIDPHLYV